MDKESFFINLFNNKFLGDDGAFIDGYVYSKDAFFENIHFKRDWFSLKDIAKKAMLVNISDAIVMNAKPLYALLCVAIPKDFSKKDLIDLSDGFLEVANKYNIKIIGGDTISNNKLDITITLISKAKKPIFRKKLRDNYLLAYTGELGDVKKDLKRLFLNKKIKKNSKFKTPILKDKFFYRANRFIKTALDISDGLDIELSRLSKINKVGFKFFKKFNKNIFCSGEEYEILFSFDIRDKNKLLRISKLTKTNITIFAKAIRRKYKQQCKNHHF